MENRTQIIKDLFYRGESPLDFLPMDRYKKIKFCTIRELKNGNFILFHHGNSIYESSNKKKVIDKAVNFIETGKIL